MVILMAFMAFSSIPTTLAGTNFLTLYLLDTHGSNFLFRGGDSTIEGVFAYDTLVSEMNQLAELPSSFTMVIFNFLYNTTATKYAFILTELTYWQQNPTKGYSILHPLYGSTSSPYSLDDATIRTKAQNISAIDDDLPSLFAQVRGLMGNGSPIMIYTHCSCGCDRTGEFRSAYIIEFQGKNLTQTRNINAQLINREMAFTNQYRTEWYCYYLKYTLSFDILCKLMGPGVIVLLNCTVDVRQTLVSYWNSGGSFYMQWSVAVSNLNRTASIPLIYLYAGTSTAGIVSAWQYSFASSPYVLPPSYHPGLGARETFEWRYIIKDLNPVYLLAVKPDICIMAAQPYPAPDFTCHVTILQSVTGIWYF